VDVNSNHSVGSVQVFPAAVAEDVTVARFHIARRNRATSHLHGFGTTQTGGIRVTELVPTVTLNWLAANFFLPDIIKIDVEGAEMSVLTEGAEVLKNCPAIICEVADRNASAVADLLASYGYTIYDGNQQPHVPAPLTLAPPTTVNIHVGACWASLGDVA
jgi:FkbM family methyltransferase